MNFLKVVSFFKRVLNIFLKKENVPEPVEQSCYVKKEEPTSETRPEPEKPKEVTIEEVRDKIIEGAKKRGHTFDSREDEVRYADRQISKKVVDWKLKIGQALVCVKCGQVQKKDEKGKLSPLVKKKVMSPDEILHEVYCHKICI